jgi:Tol biopolymer transport system component
MPTLFSGISMVMLLFLITLHLLFADDTGQLPSPSLSGRGHATAHLRWDIAYTSTASGSAGIYLLSHGQSTLLSSRVPIAEQPAWSPDGKKIAFAGKRGENWNIYVLTIGSGQVERLTSSRGADTFPAWSPDGRTIAFMSNRGGSAPENNIYLVDGDGKNERRFTRDIDHTEYPSWSPDGMFLVFSGRGKTPLRSVRGPASDTGAFPVEIFVARSDGKGVRQLTNEKAVSFLPNWSSSGKLIAFSSNREAGPNQLGEVQIYTMTVDGSRIRQLTRLKAQSSAPKWSPDNSKIVFHSSVPIERAKNSKEWRLFRPAELYVMDADGSNLIRLTNNEVDDYFPAWRPVPGFAK